MKPEADTLLEYASIWLEDYRTILLALPVELRSGEMTRFLDSWDDNYKEWLRLERIRHEEESRIKATVQASNSKGESL